MGFIKGEFVITRSQPRAGQAHPLPIEKGSSYNLLNPPLSSTVKNSSVSWEDNGTPQPRFKCYKCVCKYNAHRLAFLAEFYAATYRCPWGFGTRTLPESRARGTLLDMHAVGMKDLRLRGAIKKLLHLGWYPKAVLRKMELCNKIIKWHMLTVEVFLGECKQVKCLPLRMGAGQPEELPIVEMKVLNLVSLLNWSKLLSSPIWGSLDPISRFSAIGPVGGKTSWRTR